MQDPADLKSFDRYSYVTNNPVNIFDPSGHSGIAIHDSYGDQVVNSSWQKLVGKFTFSAYIYALESEYPSHDAFLNRYDGVGMQGTGIQKDGTYVFYNGNGHWEDSDGNNVVISNYWHKENDEEKIDPKSASVHLVNGAFSYSPESKGYVPYTTIAADTNVYPKGTIIYNPTTGDIYIVSDHCNACIGNNRFDLFVGNGFTPYNEWMNDPRRSNNDVFIYKPTTNDKEEVYDDKL